MMPREYDITGKIVFITGAGRGIGKGIAQVLAEAGADIALNALTPKYVEGVAKDIAASSGRRVVPVVADVTKPDTVKRAVDQVLQTFGRIDVLVNALGNSIRKPLAQAAGQHTTPAASDEELRFIMDVNLTEALLCTRAVGPHMLARRLGQGNQHRVVGHTFGRARHGALHHGEDRARRFHPGAGAGMGALWHPCQRNLARLFPRRGDLGRGTRAPDRRADQEPRCR